MTGRSDKYLAITSDDTTIAKNIYYRVKHSRRHILSKFQLDRSCSFVLTTCGRERVRILEKYSVTHFLFLKEMRSEIKNTLRCCVR